MTTGAVPGGKQKWLVAERGPTESPRIYASAMQYDAAVEWRLAPEALDLARLLRESGCDVLWRDEWQAYDRIEAEIASCHALVAIVDTVWTSSTWKLSEVTYALGEMGVSDATIPLSRAIPTFLFPADGSLERHWLTRYPGIVVLERDPRSAARAICDALGYRTEED